MIARLFHYLRDLLDPVDVGLTKPAPVHAPLVREKSYAAAGAKVRVNPGCDGRYDQAKAVEKKVEADKRDARRRQIAAQASRPKPPRKAAQTVQFERKKVG